MLSEIEVIEYCQAHGLSSQAQAVLAAIRNALPSRRVDSNGKNATVRYTSHKMGVTIQAESYKNELPSIVEMEHDDNVYEFYDQPLPITLRYESKNGRRIGAQHTPDFFVIRKDGLGWVECKTEEELLRLAEDKPNRYVRGDDGKWHCPPGAAVATPLGFYYQVRSSAEIHWVFQRNIRFLEHYWREDCPPVSDAARSYLCTLVEEEPGIRLDKLLKRLEETTSDDLYTLIATEALYVDLYAVPLPEPDRVHIFRDKETSESWAIMVTEDSPIAQHPPHTVLVEPDAPVVWDEQPWTILNTGATTISLLSKENKLIELPNERFHALVALGKIVGLTAVPENGSLRQKAHERLKSAQKADLKEAVRRFKCIKPILDGREATDNTSAGRAKRRWIARYHDAEQIHGCGFIGLLPDYYCCGNRTERLDEKTEETIKTFIEKEYENHKQKKKREVYGEFVNFCRDNGLPTPPSYKTFVAMVIRRPHHEQIKKRAGSRAAYEFEPPYWELSWTLPRHGDRPFEIGHIDHTQLDVELVDSKTGKNLGKPWATFFTDAFSRRLLAIYLSFERPSHKSCMMVIRECVRRHNRLPQFIIVDWGAEFESVYFEALLARYDCTKISRPKGKPRFGEVIERLFNTANTTFIHNLAGNTQVTKNVRKTTKSVDPRRLAVWTLEELYVSLRQWAYEVYDTKEHAGIGQTPQEAFIQGLLQGGARKHTEIPYDDDFIYDTLPTTRKGTAQLKTMGIKIHYLYYSARGNAFTNHPELRNKQIEVRYDPYDVGHAYAMVAGEWVECISQYYAQFDGRSEEEIKIASEELRKQYSRPGQQFTITAAKLAAFITSIEAKEPLLLQQRRDAEAAAVLARINDPSGKGLQAIATNGSRVVSEKAELVAATPTALAPQIKRALPSVTALCEDF